MAFQHIGNELSRLAVVVAEGAIVGNSPQRAVLVFHDKEVVACGTVGWRWSVGIEPSGGHRLRIDYRHALSFGKCPYHVVPVYVGFLHFCYGLIGVLHTDDVVLNVRGLYTTSPILVAIIN